MFELKGMSPAKERLATANFAEGVGELNSEEFVRFLTNSCGLLAKHSKNGAIHFIFMDWAHLSELLAAGREAYTELKNIAVWVKSAAGMGSLYRSQHELVCVFKSGTAPHTNNIQLGKNGRHRTNIWRYDSASTQARKHAKATMCWSCTLR